MQHLREGLPAPVHLDEPGEESQGDRRPLPEDFYIDMDVCMNCGLCSEYCPFDAIKMDQNFELSNYERHQTHIYSLQDLLVSSEYYAKTHPDAWSSSEEVAERNKVAKKKDQRLQKALAATKAAHPAAKPARPPSLRRSDEWNFPSLGLPRIPRDPPKCRVPGSAPDVVPACPEPKQRAEPQIPADPPWASMRCGSPFRFSPHRSLPPAVLSIHHG